jgi:hypothetical protein
VDLEVLDCSSWTSYLTYLIACSFKLLYIQGRPKGIALRWALADGGGVGRIRHHSGRFGSKRGGVAGSCFVLRLEAVRRRQDAEKERGTKMDYTPRPPRQAAAAGSTPRVAPPPSPEATRLPEAAEIAVSRIRACTCWICERPTVLDLRDNRMTGGEGGTSSAA